MLTTAEAAKQLGISQRRVQELIKSGLLPAQKVSGIWLLDEESVCARFLTVDKRGGRPRRGKSRYEHTFTLMNRTHEIVSVIYSTSRKDFVSIGSEVNAVHAPIGLATLDGRIPLEAFRNWWRGRGIPIARVGLTALLTAAGVDVPDELIQRNLGLSLSDQYWIKPTGTDLKWEDINFFNNDFERVSLATQPYAVEGQSAPARPDNTSDGNLQKYWSCENELRVLHKGGIHLGQEPYNEVVATALHGRLLGEDEFVPYSLEGSGSTATCRSDDFLSDEEEYVPAFYVDKVIPKTTSDGGFEHYLACCEQLGVVNARGALNRMITCDDILANYDRHWRNFGIVRNVNTLECRPAPLFDSGSSLWCNVSLDALMAGEHSFSSAQFHPSPAKQMLLVDDLSWFSSEAMDGFVDEAIGILSGNEAITPRLPYIRKAVTWRVNRMIDIAEWS